MWGELLTLALSAGALKGRALAAIIMSGFGALWMVSGANFFRRLTWANALLIAVITAVLGWGATRELAASRSAASRLAILSAPEAATEWSPALRRDFQWVLAMEWLPIVAVAIIFARVRRPHLILPAIAIIVGLHFLPLAKLFGTPLYYFTGAALILATVAALRIRDIARRQGFVCLACGLILWITSALLLIY